LPLAELWAIEDFVNKINRPSEAILGIFYFKFVNVPHLSTVACEVFWQTCLMTKFWDQENFLITHVNKKEWLIGFGDVFLVHNLHVLYQVSCFFNETFCCFYTPFKHIFLGCFFFIIRQAVNLVGFCVILC
jgi:hypothetical protein